ncbi:MAG: glycosyltransferase family 4 protein [Nitrososphaera sp.]|nr:glycosyltransferase family 4 protein [Nitrososphaera sp.]
MPAKLLSLNTYYYRRGGSEAVFFEHDALFRSLGWETAVFAMKHPDNEPSHWSRFFVEEMEFGFKYSPAQKLAMAGKVIYSLEARSKLSRLLALFQPDIAHAHLIYHHLSPSVLTLLHARGIPIVMTAHDLKIACPAYKMLNSGGICEKCKNGNLLHVALNRCINRSLAVSLLIMLESSVHKLLGVYRNNLDRIVVPSMFYRDKLVEWGWPPEKLVYIPNFVHGDRFQPRFEPGSYFLYFGRLALEKGLRTLVIAAKTSRIKLFIAGLGPIEDELRQLADGVDGSIQFLGRLAGERLFEIVRNARAVVVPSEWYENAPMNVLEAYANGKIVIAARIGGISELVLEGETGYLFESGSVEDLTESLTRVSQLTDVRLREMGHQAREYVTSRFTKERYLADMIALYSSLGVKDIIA